MCYVGLKVKGRSMTVIIPEVQPVHHTLVVTLVDNIGCVAECLLCSGECSCLAAVEMKCYNLGVYL